MPELEGALKSLDSLNKNDIGEIRGYTNAPKAVEKTMAAVLTILKEPKQDWDHAKSVLGDPNFLRRAGPPRQRWGQTPLGGGRSVFGGCVFRVQPKPGIWDFSPATSGWPLELSARL